MRANFIPPKGVKPRIINVRSEPRRRWRASNPARPRKVNCWHLGVAYATHKCNHFQPERFYVSYAATYLLLLVNLPSPLSRHSFADRANHVLALRS